MSDSRVVGNSPELERALHAARLAAFVDAPVLVSGQAGAGRSLLAQVVHANGNRRDKPILHIQSASQLHDTLLHDELDLGKIAGGTLLLAELEKLDAESQQGLLNLLQQGVFKRLDVRLLVTASDQLIDRVSAGDFLEALYYQLNIISIELEPLSARPGDIKLLLNHFLSYYGSHYKRSVPKYSKQALQILKQYEWPGNVRELRNLCERMTILLPGKTIMPENLPQEFREQKRKAAIPGFVLPDDGINLELLEQDLIRQALDQSEGNRSKAARLLGITRDTLNYRLKKFALGS